MNTENQSKKTNNSSRNTKNDIKKPKRPFDLRKWLRRIGIFAGIVVLISVGLSVGLFLRMYYEPRLITYNFQGFSAALPFKPSVEVLNGMPPFSNRKMLRYRVIVSDEVEYQILVLDVDRSAIKIDNPLDLKLTTNDSELEQWAESTIAVLCADENRAIKQGCLQKGSRLTRWSVITSDGRNVNGNIQRDRSGRMIQFLAVGTSDEDTIEFFDSFKSQ